MLRNELLNAINQDNGKLIKINILGENKENDNVN